MNLAGRQISFQTTCSWLISQAAAPVDYRDPVTITSHSRQLALLDNLIVGKFYPGSGLPEKYVGGGGPKVELNPKPKKTPILGQFGALKKYSVFPFQTQTYSR